MIPISSDLSNLSNQVIYWVMWSSDLKSHEKMPSNDTHIIPFEELTQSSNIESCDHQIWNLMKKCCLMIPISSHLSNLSNHAIYWVMWPSDLKSHGKMLSNEPISSHLSNLPNQAIYMISISSHLSNLPNQVIYKVMWLLHWIPTPTHHHLNIYPYSLIY